MRSYSLSILGQNVSFKAEADQERIDQAKRLITERFERLDTRGRQIGKEKLLIFLALGLADDLLQSNQKLSDIEHRISLLLAKIDEGAAEGASLHPPEHGGGER